MELWSCGGGGTCCCGGGGGGGSNGYPTFVGVSLTASSSSSSSGSGATIFNTFRHIVTDMDVGMK